MSRDYGEDDCGRSEASLLIEQAEGMVVVCGLKASVPTIGQRGFIAVLVMNLGWMITSVGNTRFSLPCLHKSDASSASRQPARRFP